MALDTTVASTPALFCVALIGLGVCLQLFYTSATATVLLAAADSVRGQVMGAYAVAYFGGGALGGPIVGWLDQQLGARGGMLIGGAIPALATVLVALKLARSAPTRRARHRMALEPRDA